MKTAVVFSALLLSILGEGVNDETCRHSIYPDNPLYWQLNESESSITLGSFELADYPLEQDENVTISMIADWLDRGTQLKSIYVTSDYCEHGKRAKEPTQYLCKDDYE